MSLLKKLPSLSQISNLALETLRRFPIVLLVSFAGTIFSILTIYDVIKGDEIGKILMSLSLSLTLFLSVKLYSERVKKQLLELTLTVTSIILLCLYYFSLPEEINSDEFSKFFVLNIALHLLVAFAAFIGTSQLNEFWQFNKTIFIRIITAVLYTGTITAGILGALVAIRELLGIDINEKFFGATSVVILGVFNTWFFLAGVPKKRNDLDTETDYPKELKVFTQFVLLPLVALYLFILYCYEAKIIINWNLPQGYVSYLINIFSILGIFAFLLIWPIRNNSENKWIQLCSKWFYILLYPLIVLQQVSIWTRINEYGITESRYYILVLSFWLLAITLYFTFSKVKNIKLIPITLCLLGLLSIYGPQSAGSVSLNSQVNRLENLLIKNKILVDGKIKKHTITIITFEDEKSISSILEYLNTSHGFKKINPWFNLDIEAVRNSYYKKYTFDEELAENYLGISYRNKYDTHAISHNERDKTFFSENSTDIINCNGYNKVLKFDLNKWDDNFKKYYDKTHLISVAKQSIMIHKYDSLVIRIKLSKQIKQLLNQTDVNSHLYKPNLLIFTGDKFKLQIDKINLSGSTDNYEIESIEGYILLK